MLSWEVTCTDDIQLIPRCPPLCRHDDDEQHSGTCGSTDKQCRSPDYSRERPRTPLHSALDFEAVARGSLSDRECARLVLACFDAGPRQVLSCSFDATRSNGEVCRASASPVPSPSTILVLACCVLRT